MRQKAFCAHLHGTDRHCPRAPARQMRKAVGREARTVSVRCAYAGIRKPLSGGRISPSGVDAGRAGIEQETLVNDEAVLGAAVFRAGPQVAGIIAVGGGTITDLGRFVGSRLHKPFVLYMTCPSMDGYALGVAGMMVQGTKVIYKDCRFPDGIFSQTQVLCGAPRGLIQSGYGDMLGKRTALADWVLLRDPLREANISFPTTWWKKPSGNGVSLRPTAHPSDSGRWCPLICMNGGARRAVRIRAEAAWMSSPATADCGTVGSHWDWRQSCPVFAQCRGTGLDSA